MDAFPVTGTVHSTPAARACEQTSACKALERGLREGMPAAAICRGVQLSPAKQQDLIVMLPSHHVAYAQPSFSGSLKKMQSMGCLLRKIIDQASVAWP